MKRLRNGRKTPPPPRAIKIDWSTVSVTVDGVDITACIHPIDDRPLAVAAPVTPK